MKKLFMFIVLVIATGLLSSCTDSSKEVNMEDTYFYDVDMTNAENLEFDNSWANVVDQLEYYWSTPYEEQPNLQDVWNFDIDNTEDSEYENYKVYKSDLEDPNVFQYNYSFLKYLSYEVEYINQVVNNQNIVSGETLDFEATYSVENCCNSDGFYEVDVTSDFTLLAHLGVDYVYIELDEYNSQELVNSSVAYIKYNDTDITEFKMYKYNLETEDNISIKDYSYIDYKIEEDSVYLKIEDNGSEKIFSYAEIDEFGSYDSLTFNGYVPQVVSYDSENELYFWSMLLENTDYRNLSVYKDGVFQLEHQLLYHTDTQSFQEYNNTITYNAKYVDGWEYYLGGKGETDNGSSYYTTLSGDGINLHILMPNYVITVDEEIDAFITEENYSNITTENGDEHYTYNQIPYSTFIEYWDSYEDIWEHFSYSENAIVFNDTSYSIENSNTLLSSFAGDEIIDFIENVVSKTEAISN